MTFDQSDLNPKKKSLGALRKATKTKERSPDLTGQLKLQRHTMETIAKQFEETDRDDIVCCLAGWNNHDGNGPYLTIELSPRYVRREYRPNHRSNLAFIFDDNSDLKLVRSTPPDVHVAFRLANSMLNAVDVLCDKLDVTRSQFIRKSIGGTDKGA